MERRTKVLALVAHDNMKHDLAEWVDWNSKKLGRHHLVCTGTTGKMVEKTLRDHREEYEGEEEIEELPDLRITLLKSGPLGGDQQLGSLIADGKIDALIFFWDPMSAQPHDVDVKALLRLATLYNVPTAINRSSADFLISSPLFEDDGYVPVVQGLQSLCRARAEIGWRAVLQVVRQRGGHRPLTSKSPQRRAIESSVSNSSGMSSDVTSFRRVGLKSGSPLK